MFLDCWNKAYSTQPWWWWLWGWLWWALGDDNNYVYDDADNAVDFNSDDNGYDGDGRSDKDDDCDNDNDSLWSQ